jgi:hypothetical protein
MRGNVMPDDVGQVPTRLRTRFPHPLRGTSVAHRYRRTRRWLNATLLARRHNAALPADALTLSFYPERPHRKTQITRIAAELGVRIGFDPRTEGPVIFWDQGTGIAPRHAARLPGGAINDRCTDITKTTVQRAFGQAAGYELAVDPLTFDGPLVVKSERNGFHDGRRVIGPLPAREAGHVYERLVDATEGDVLVTVRTPIINGQIPIVMIKWRNTINWFSGYALAEPRPTEEVFAADEVAMMLRFAASIGMDYGELDVMRDRHDGRVYIVDANRTPMRNPWMKEHHNRVIYPAMAEAFRPLLER